MPKSRDAFRTISEVAEWLDTPAHVLRFWESKFTQVKPVKRAGGRRYYRPADMLLLGGIKKLLHDDGLTIKGAQKLLREHGVKHVSSLSQALDPDVVEEAGFIDVEVPDEPEEAQVLDFKPRNRPEEATNAVADVTPVALGTDEERPAPIDPTQPAPSDAPVPDAQRIVSSDVAAPQTPESALLEEAEDLPVADVEMAQETRAPMADGSDSGADDSPVPDTVSDLPDAETTNVPEPEVETGAETPQAPTSPAVEPAADSGFGGDSLPAFMRRSPVPGDEGSASLDGPSAPEAPGDGTAKVTIDPVATFVPMSRGAASVNETGQDYAAEAADPITPSPEPTQTSEGEALYETSAAEPASMDSATPEAENPATEAATPITPDTPQQSPPEPAQEPAPRVLVDVPPLAKIAPELSSYPDQSGVLTALSGTRTLDKSMADEILPHLHDLRALRDRMVQTGRG